MADRAHEIVTNLIWTRIAMQVEFARLHDHGHEFSTTITPAPGLDETLQQMISTSDGRHNYSYISADDNARQHNGDSILYSQVNHFTVIDSIVNVTGSNHIASSPNTSPYAAFTHKSLDANKRDTASMFVHRDDSSVRSWSTDACSKLSLRFSFDRRLWSTGVYEKQMRPLFIRNIEAGRMKRGLLSSDHGGDIAKDTDLSPATRRRSIDCQQWSPDIKRTRRPIENMRARIADILLLGVSNDDTAMVIARFMDEHGYGYTARELIHWRTAIHRDVVHYTKTLVNFVSEFDVKLGELVDQDILMSTLSPNSSKHWQGPFEDGIRMAVVRLWEDPIIAIELQRQLSHQVPDSAL